ncbi:MAG: UDP-N-acetylmuramate--alanine ligase [Alphaproteobacteria bacterium]|nr:UDP-N-acetylmuramate--alanine ligase [Alphaproteobacteria bacterium]
MKYYFCGIGGIGMSSIAQYLALKGNQVFGSDRAFDLGDNTKTKEFLQSLGIQIFPQDGSGVTDDIDYFVTSTAIEAQIPDVQKARQLNLKIRRRAEMLAEILHSYTGIAVGGTSGKTTITAMVGHILSVCGLSPTIINGGILINTYETDKEPSNFIMGSGDFCVIESDESDGTIELYNPAISIVSNISLDHKPLAELRPLFKEFIERTKKGVVLNLDCAETAAFRNVHPNTITFSCQKDSGAGLIATDITPTDQGIDFKVNGITTHLQVMGKHNIENALAAMGAALLAGVDLEKSADALASFKGTKRRLEKIGTVNDITVFDDYAHNPEKISASLQTLHRDNHTLWAVFQPHGFTPTRLMKNELIEAFATKTGSDDVLIFPEIFYQGGTVAKDISSKDLVTALTAKGKKAFFFEDRADIPEFIARQAQSGDRIVVMGARDGTLTNLAKDILTAVGDNK